VRNDSDPRIAPAARRYPWGTAQQQQYTNKHLPRRNGYDLRLLRSFGWRLLRTSLGRFGLMCCRNLLVRFWGSSFLRDDGLIEVLGINLLLSKGAYGGEEHSSRESDGLEIIRVLGERAHNPLQQSGIVKASEGPPDEISQTFRK
jgi:hypothetical protein